jgi:hypothetical protein
LINTCHDARFAPHVGANVNAGQCNGVEKHLSKMPREPALRNTCRCPRTSLPQRAFHPTDHVQQDIHPTDNPPQSARKSGAGKTRRRVGRRRGRLPSLTHQNLRALVMQSFEETPLDALIDRIQAEQHLEMMRLRLMAGHPQEGTAVVISRALFLFPPITLQRKT